MTDTTDKIRDFIKDYYGRELTSGDDLKTNACCAAGAPPRHVAETLENIHDDVMTRFYGCGFPIPVALKGAIVVDLGCGTGRDVYSLSQLVGEEGFVHGVDMTAEQLELASDTISWHMERFGYAKPNVAFYQGYIEDLAGVDIASGSADLVVSNCVFNLSPRKDLVLKGCFDLLKEGGELYFSDVFCDRRLPEDVASDPVLHAECLGGAMYQGDFLAMARAAGFTEPRLVSVDAIEVDAEIADMVGTAQFTSLTWRLFKLDDLEPASEDYGQIATYKGGVPGAERVLWLDDHHAFEAHRPERICGNTASMLSKTRFAPYFDVVGTRKIHFGPFPCDGTLAMQVLGEDTSSQLSSNPSSRVPSSSGSCC